MKEHSHFSHPACLEVKKQCIDSEKANRLRVASRKYYDNEKNKLKKGAYYVKKRLREGKHVTTETLQKYAEYIT